MSKPSVLVAEDESALVTLLRYNLEREGYRVLEARDGEEALLVAAEEQPDLVVLDWMLPQLSGIEVCRRLRGRQETRNVPIVMLTARGEESDRAAPDVWRHRRGRVRRHSEDRQRDDRRTVQPDRPRRHTQPAAHLLLPAIGPRR